LELASQLVVVSVVVLVIIATMAPATMVAVIVMMLVVFMNRTIARMGRTLFGPLFLGLIGHLVIRRLPANLTIGSSVDCR
jgi:hypothetical protein